MRAGGSRKPIHNVKVGPIDKPLAPLVIRGSTTRFWAGSISFLTMVKAELINDDLLVVKDMLVLHILVILPMTNEHIHAT